MEKTLLDGHRNNFETTNTKEVEERESGGGKSEEKQSKIEQ